VSGGKKRVERHTRGDLLGREGEKYRPRGGQEDLEITFEKKKTDKGHTTVTRGKIKWNKKQLWEKQRKERSQGRL